MDRSVTGDSNVAAAEVGVRRRDHRDLILWQRAMALATEVYRATDSFPAGERYGLTAQLRRAAVSVISNVAEGAARRSPREFAAFLYVTRGSLAELESQLQLAHRVGLCGRIDPLQARIDEVGRLTNAVIRGLERRIAASTRGRAGPEPRRAPR